MKYLFYTVIALILYRMFFTPTRTIVYRDNPPKKNDSNSDKKVKKNNDDYIDFEELK
jgi:hypothetical protein